MIASGPVILCLYSIVKSGSAVAFPNWFFTLTGFFYTLPRLLFLEMTNKIWPLFMGDR